MLVSRGIRALDLWRDADPGVAGVEMLGREWLDYGICNQVVWQKSR